MFEYFDMSGEILHLGGIPVTKIVEEYGTPLYVYDADVARAKYEKLTRAVPQYNIFYSLKANPSISMCSLFRSFGSKAEVASGGELFKALKAGFQPKDIIFVGPAKTREEIEYAIESNVYAIIVESTLELRMLDELCETLDTESNVMLRINRESFTGEAPELMIGGPSKFGFDEEEVVPSVSNLNLSHVRIIGVHIYAASGLLEVDPVIENAEATIQLGRSYADALNFELQCLDIGGGIGVPYSETEEEFDIQTLGEQMDSLLSQYELENVKLILEAGRYLVAECGVFLTKVHHIKKSRGTRYVFTDGGMNHEIRPVFMDLNHPTKIVNKLSHPATGEATIAGPLCTPIDVIAEDIPLPKVERGDIVGLFNAGAYGMSMSMLNFLSHPWPSEVLAYNGDTYLLRDRGSFEDIKSDEYIIMF
ncbi:MAG: diaminopimelate decarboxylase [Candidatus Korarchaeota archaeon]|nr:diaminopimelate decarboxylase [Candidatus Korarchaeota archaeon]NIU81935.1 diaminopimelate decarboxylase [Candidatus Thorarchaeota archaeon]NIW12393.1 diaminopimelate decarboxylase [Candidatus Thorarchaeota archaeon]NIW51185.1 diaminopimelate decarboxylase [Candidatus Korarchaeota archaeon]